MLTKGQLAALASSTTPPAVSIYVPVRRDTRDIREGAVRLKNALAAASDQLLAQGHRRPDVVKLLEPAQAVVEDGSFWREERDNLALFLAPGLFQLHKLPSEPPELVVVAPRPHVKPLLPMLADDGRFYVLAASAGDARLYVGSRAGLVEIEADMPRSVAEISAETDYQNMRHAAPAARPRTAAPVGMPATHNFGEDPEEQRKAQLIEYLRRLHNALEDRLAGDRAPTVLVAPPEVHGHLRALAKDVAFHGEGLQIDPAALDLAELHRETYELVRPLFARRRAEDLERFRALAGSGDPRAATSLPDVLAAAPFGRVEALLVAEDVPVWGVPDAAEGEARIEPEPTAENQDLTDYAAVQALLQGGRVHVLPRAEMPAEGALAAILRY